MKKKIRKQSLYEGAFILMFGGIIVKIIGAMFKLPLQNLIGEAGTAYFTVAYDIYTWMYIITTAGLPVALSRMVAEYNAQNKSGDAKRTLKVAFTGFMFLGALVSLAMLIFAGPLANIFGSPDSKYAIMAIAPAILFEVVMSCYRGYNQGYKNMIPTAISQIIVAIVKLGAGILCALFILNRFEGHPLVIPFAAAGAIFGVTIGCLFGAIYIAITSKLHPYESERHALAPTFSQKSILKKLVAIAIPITIGASVLSITNLVDTMMLFHRLKAAGFDQSTTEFMYGSYSWARTMFNLPTAVIVPLSVAVVPAIAEQYAVRKYGEAKNTIESTLRVAALLALPSGLGLAVLAKPIMHMLYAAQPQGADFAAPLLTALGPAVVLVCMVSITNALLQSMGKEMVPIVTMVIGGVLKIACNYILVGMPSININGAPIGTNLCYGVITVLNLIVIVKSLGKGISIFRIFSKPLVSSMICCVGAWFTYDVVNKFTGNAISTLAAMAVAGIIYVILTLMLKTLRREDVKLLPKAEKIEKVLDKFGWIG